MSTTTVECANCTKIFEKDNREINRCRKKGMRNFCSTRCSGIESNKDRKAQVVILACRCGKKFSSSTKARHPRHCSRVCASLYSVTPKRRKAARLSGAKSKNLIKVHEALRRREKWRYERLERYLKSNQRNYVFEFPIGRFVYDLALIDTKTIVEFDGPTHRQGFEVRNDRAKDKLALKNGFKIIRIQTQTKTVLHSKLLMGL